MVQGQEHNEFLEWQLLEKIRVKDDDIFIENGAKGLVIELSASFKGRLHKPWVHSVIVKLLGKSIRYKILCTRLRAIWHASKSFWGY